MAAPISNTTQQTCAICHEDYQGKEISDVTKVVELACHHFYHIGCIAQSLRYQENGQRDMSCCYCNQKVASPAWAINVFAHQEIFQKRLEEIKKDYDYDNEVIAAASIVDCLYTSLHVLSNTVLMESHDAVAIRWRRRTDLKFLSAIGDLVIKSEMI